MTDMKMRTTLIWQVGDTEMLADAIVSYSVSPGYAATWEEPGCDTSVEITGILSSNPVPAHFIDDDDLIAECLADWLDREEAAADDAADRRREELRDDRNQWEHLS